MCLKGKKVWNKYGTSIYAKDSLCLPGRLSYPSLHIPFVVRLLEFFFYKSSLCWDIIGVQRMCCPDKVWRERSMSWRGWKSLGRCGEQACTRLPWLSGLVTPLTCRVYPTGPGWLPGLYSHAVSSHCSAPQQSGKLHGHWNHQRGSTELGGWRNWALVHSYPSVPPASRTTGHPTAQPCTAPLPGGLGRDGCS